MGPCAEPGLAQQAGLRRGHVLASLKRVLRQLKIRTGNVHSFRRFFISHCANSGVPPFQVMTWVGHADMSMVLRYYNLADSESRRAMAGVPFGDPDEPSRTDPKQAQSEHNGDARKTG